MNAKKQGYVIRDDANETVRSFISGMTLGDRMDFGNARGMRNTLEKLVQAQANRLAGETGEITRDMLQEITLKDAVTALDIASEEEHKKPETAAVSGAEE